MTDKIKKVNNLEELGRLSIGERVNIIYFERDEGNGLYVFEKRIKKEYHFIEFYPLIMHIHKLNKENIKFKNGMIQVKNSNKVPYGEFYNLGTKGYKERLNLIPKKLRW